jgi:DNA replication initiation complex subunit (GINS family)
MITFNDLYEAVRKEKYSDSLQVLPAKFLQEASQYFEEKREFLAKEEDMFSDIAIKNKKKLENALTSFKDLIRIRKKKILNLAFVAAEVGISKKDFENMFGYEKDLFEEVTKALESAEKDRSTEMSGESKTEFKHRLVRFLENVPEFLNFEGEEIGPFEKGEIHNLEADVVGILEKDKRVEVIDYD